MTDICTVDQNFQQAHNFQLVFDRLPEMVYTCIRVAFPGMSSNFVDVQTPFQSFAVSGSTARYELLTVTFLLNEDWSNYNSIKKWIEGLTFPQGFDQREQLIQESTLGAIESDCSLNVFDSANRLSRSIVFKDAFPLSITGFSLDSQIETPTPIEIVATFKYLNYDLG